MYSFVYDDELKYNCEVLDKIDIKKYIEVNNTPYDIMEHVQYAYEDNRFPEEITKLVENSILEGDLFNYISIEEFMDYLYERYKLHFKEVIQYYASGFEEDVDNAQDIHFGQSQ